MARRRTRSLGIRLVLALAIPALYCLAASLAGLATAGQAAAASGEESHGPSFAPSKFSGGQSVLDEHDESEVDSSIGDSGVA